MCVLVKYCARHTSTQDIVRKRTINYSNRLHVYYECVCDDCGGGADADADALAQKKSIINVAFVHLHGQDTDAGARCGAMV